MLTDSPCVYDGFFTGALCVCPFYLVDAADFFSRDMETFAKFSRVNEANFGTKLNDDLSQVAKLESLRKIGKVW